MKTAVLAGIALSVSLWGCISADAPPDDPRAEATATQSLGSSGPFATKQDVINYWNNYATSQAVQIFLNGRIIVNRLGFGPAIIDQYFVCTSSSDSIYETCPAAVQAWDDGYAVFSTLLSRIPGDPYIYKDGVLYHTGTSSEIYSIKTCSGDQSLIGTIHYSIVEDYTGFGSYHADCYP